jgi:hypothetical protein
VPISPPSQSSFLHRIAAAQPAEGENTGLSKAQMGAMGVAAASPFAGLLGEKPIINDPLKGAKGVDYATLNDLEEAAMPGDILVTSKPKGSIFKNFITPTGRSQFYHAQPVTGRLQGIGYTLSAGDLYDKGIHPSQWMKYDHAIADYVQDPDTYYADVVLLRPKKKLTKEQLRTLRKDYGQRTMRPYDSTKAVSTFLRDMFIPKYDIFNYGRPETICEGNVCSTLPAQSFHTATGRSVVPGKRAQDVFPTDFMRSDEFELVGSHISPETRALANTRMQKLAPWLLRGGIGAGLAGATYAVSEDPATAAGLGGTVAAEAALNAAANSPRFEKYINAETMPTYWDAVDTMMSGGLASPEGRSLVGKTLTRRVPAALAGGALAYGGAKALGAGYDALKQRWADRSE